MKILDFNQTVQFLTLKPSHLRKLIFNREIPFFKVGRLVRFKASELEQWINKNTKEVLNEQ
ncbi:hypothetical protein A9Q84_07200 [Halobacteriovorax marinus]|uniref:Helix-turn-helix domain-containing protein n=1 Tax=Halobacteriovorax marinus TaxID=97084 RepID=A0A1Y5FBA5_9BACT|nr:hypothetical protein A9Q84_07200 [Halobacteriovorax marinus]